MVDFKKEYNKVTVWADMDKAVSLLALHEMVELAECLEKIKIYTGIDIRQKFLLGTLRHCIEENSTCK